jgi:N-methylhydantoinase B
MKVALRRTAFSPVIYEMIDFACGLYDPDFRMLGQARAIPQFLGTLSFCLESAVAAQGGAESIRPGDVLWSTNGFDNGSHSQDAVIIVPAFNEGELVGYGVTKAHQLDIAAKDPYCTDTTDNFQEGVIFPGVKLYREGVLERDMYRTVLANSRLPAELEGDLNAQIGAARTGVNELLRIIQRYGLDTFRDCVELMFDHGESMVRSFISAIPDGRYEASCLMDNNGVTDDPVEFSVAIEVNGSEVTVDFSNSPPEQEGPINCPVATTVSTARLGIMGLLGGADLPNEGHFRPIKVRVTPGTLFCPRPPAPIFLYGWPADQATEAIHQAMQPVLEHSVPAGSGGDLCGVNFWGTRDGRFWTTAMDHPAGQGATHDGDGGGPLMIISCSGIRTNPAEVLEARFPLLVEKYELAIDSAGAGRYRGGAGVDVEYRVLEECFLTSTVERTRKAPWGLRGGGEARANGIEVSFPNGEVAAYRKRTRVPLPAGTLVRLQTGGGGGYGSPADRPGSAIEGDIDDGYLSPGQAKLHYPDTA